MAEEWSIFADWNPWHGCTKVSPGCRFCYVYRQDEMYGSEIASNLARKTAAFNLPELGSGYLIAMLKKAGQDFQDSFGQDCVHVLHFGFPAGGRGSVEAGMLGNDALSERLYVLFLYKTD